MSERPDGIKRDVVDVAAERAQAMERMRKKAEPIMETRLATIEEQKLTGRPGIIHSQRTSSRRRQGAP